MFGGQRFQGMRSHARKITLLIGVILMLMGGLGLIKFAFYGVLILLVLGVIIFIAQYIRGSGGGGFRSFLERIWSDWRLIFLIIVILFSVILLFLLLFVKGGGFVSTLTNIAGNTPGIGDDSVLRPLLILVFGIFLVFFGIGVFHKVLGVLLLLAGITTGAISGTALGITDVFSKFGSANPNYMLFFIALATGIFMLWKIRGVLPKFLGVLLPLFTLPPVAERIKEGLDTIFIGFFDLYTFFGISWISLVLGIFAVLSGFYIFEKVIKRQEEFSQTMKFIGILLASLLILFSFSELGIIFFEFFNDFIFVPIFSPINDFLTGITGFAPEIGNAFGPGFYFVVGVILVFSRKALEWGYKQAGDIGVGSAIKEHARRQVERIRPRGGPGTPPRGFTP